MTDKMCVGCQRLLPSENYHKNKAAKDGLQSRCKSCIKEYTRQYRQKNKRRNSSVVTNNSLRNCTGCQTEKPVSEFYRAHSRADGYTTRCRDCTRKENNSRRWSRGDNKPRRYLEVVDGRFACRGCDIEKDISEFYKNRAMPHGYDTFCKACRSIKNKEFFDDNLGYFKERYALNPELHVAKTQRRRARKLGALVNGFAEPTSSRLRMFYGRGCLFPGCENEIATVDHVVPLSRQGHHTYYNAQPLCLSHNSSKSVSDTDYRGVSPHGVLMDVALS